MADTPQDPPTPVLGTPELLAIAQGIKSSFGKRIAGTNEKLGEVDKKVDKIGEELAALHKEVQAGAVRPLLTAEGFQAFLEELAKED